MRSDAGLAVSVGPSLVPSWRAASQEVWAKAAVAQVVILETEMEGSGDGAVLGFTRLSGSKRLYRKGDTVREAGSLVEPMTAPDPLPAIPVSRVISFSSRTLAVMAHRSWRSLVQSGHWLMCAR